MSPKGYKVPRRKVKPRGVYSGRYTAVWEHLETIPEYENLSSLRSLLIEKFGKQGTPGLSQLSRHLRQNRGNYSQNNDQGAS